MLWSVINRSLDVGFVTVIRNTMTLKRKGKTTFLLTLGMGAFGLKVFETYPFSPQIY